MLPSNKSTIISPIKKQFADSVFLAIEERKLHLKNQDEGSRNIRRDKGGEKIRTLTHNSKKEVKLCHLEEKI